MASDFFRSESSHNIAKTEEPTIVVMAQTLPEKNASTRILGKLEFTLVMEINSPEDGKVWEWEFRYGLPFP